MSGDIVTLERIGPLSFIGCRGINIIKNPYRSITSEKKTISAGRIIVSNPVFSLPEAYYTRCRVISGTTCPYDDQRADSEEF